MSQDLLEPFTAHIRTNAYDIEANRYKNDPNSHQLKGVKLNNVNYRNPLFSDTQKYIEVRPAQMSVSHDETNVSHSNVHFITCDNQNVQSGTDTFLKLHDYEQTYSLKDTISNDPENLVMHRPSKLYNVMQTGVIQSPVIHRDVKPTEVKCFSIKNCPDIKLEQDDNVIQSKAEPSINLAFGDCGRGLTCKKEYKKERPGISGTAESDEGKLFCTLCPYKCQSPAILKIHKRTHTGEKPYACNFCDYKSGQKNNLIKHILVHTEEKPYSCKFCDYKCVQKNNLVVHERTHTGEKPYACPHCDYRTVQKPNLVKHLYLHTDEKPFSCDICSYKCVQKTNLLKHRERHQNISDTNKPYKPRQKSLQCTLCTYGCVQKVSLYKHMRQKHNIDMKSSIEENQ